MPRANTGKAASTLSIKAVDTTNLKADGYGASVGAAAAGLAAGVIDRSSAVTAQFADKAKSNYFNGVTVEARDGGSATATLLATPAG